jgi:hypothetical protein
VFFQTFLINIKWMIRALCRRTNSLRFFVYLFFWGG